MLVNVVQTILEDAFGATVEGDTYKVDSDRRMIVFVEHKAGIMSIPRVTAVTFHKSYIELKGEESITYVSAEDVFGLRAGEIGESAQATRPGFRR